MTLTTPTGQLLTDLALFAIFVAFAFGVVLIGSAQEIKRGKK